jgi:hypothetical protein
VILGLDAAGIFWYLTLLLADRRGRLGQSLYQDLYYFLSRKFNLLILFLKGMLKLLPIPISQFFIIRSSISLLSVTHLSEPTFVNTCALFVTHQFMHRRGVKQHTLFRLCANEYRDMLVVQKPSSPTAFVPLYRATQQTCEVSDSSYNPTSTLPPTSLTAQRLNSARKLPWEAHNYRKEPRSHPNVRQQS